MLLRIKDRRARREPEMIPVRGIVRNGFDATVFLDHQAGPFVAIQLAALGEVDDHIPPASAGRDDADAAIGDDQVVAVAAVQDRPLPRLGMGPQHIAPAQTQYFARAVKGSGRVLANDRAIVGFRQRNDFGVDELKARIPRNRNLFADQILRRLLGLKAQQHACLVIGSVLRCVGVERTPVRVEHTGRRIERLVRRKLQPVLAVAQINFEQLHTRRAAIVQNRQRVGPVA